jgi:Flp pilus assembly protein TadG
VIRWMRRIRSGATENDCGMVTVELATALPVLVLLAVVGVMAIGVGGARIRCGDAAREAARAVARGDPAAAAGLAGAAAGRPVAVESSKTANGDTTVTVRMRLRPVSWLGTITVSESAVVATEPGVGEEPRAAAGPRVAVGEPGVPP